MHATFVTLWLQVVQPLANVHETKWTPHVKRETDVAQSMKHVAMLDHASCDVKLPNSVYSGYVISVFSYFVRFTLFL